MDGDGIAEYKKTGSGGIWMRREECKLAELHLFTRTNKVVLGDGVDRKERRTAGEVK